MVTKGHILTGILNNISILLHQALKVSEKQAVKGKRYSEKKSVLGILNHTTFQNTVQLSQPPKTSTKRCSLKIVVIKVNKSVYIASHTYRFC